MIRHFVAAAALAFLAGAGAHAQTAPLVKAHYVGTLQFTAIDDPFGFCTNLVQVGETQISVGGFGPAVRPIVITPIAGSASAGYGVADQSCVFPVMPATLDPSGTTVYSGTTSCNVPNPTYPTARIVTGQSVDGLTGSGTINSVGVNSFKITTQNAALEVQIQGKYTPICYISTDALYVRTGT